MKKPIIVIITILTLAVVILIININKEKIFSPINNEQFCGSSTFGECSNNKECTSGGCSGQICQSIHEEPAITTCEYRTCYNNEAYNLDCQCIQNKCQWA
ncbi:MAG: eight-cysteine-cluster domain-containing protein [Candidatus Woesearchaeota archaeon]|nr:MAG: eight-cysteine-cluster domain-containing protein [Candidatus Woesearchaeota archaeon]